MVVEIKGLVVILFASDSYAMDVRKNDFVSSSEIVEALRNVYEKYGGSFILHSVNKLMILLI